MTRHQTAPISLLAFAALVGLAVFASGCGAPSPTATVVYTTEHAFKSGGSREWEEASISFPKDCFQPGKNTIVLENANPASSGHFLIWDSIGLRDAAGSVVWELGANEAPQEYGPPAFDEFQQNPPFRSDFDVQSMPVDQFPKELNDGTFPRVAIHFSLTPDQADADLVLFLDTLYATHDQVPDFKLRISVER